MKIRRATMAVVAAGALVLSGCTSDPETSEGETSAPAGGETDEGSESAGDDGGETSDAGGDAGGEEGSTAKADLSVEQCNDDSVAFSSGAEEYNAYNGATSSTNSTYNAVVNNQLFGGFWYWGTDGTIYPNEWFGSYEVTSEDPLTVEYTISDEAVWSDGTPVTSNDFLLEWASTNPPALFGERDEEGANEGTFDPVSTSFGDYASEGLETEVGSKNFTVTYPEPYPDWELLVSAALPSHVAAEQSDLEPDALAQAILDGDGETVGQVAEFWNTGWLFPDYQVTDEALVPSSGPYTLEGATWQSGQSLGLVPNEEFYGPTPATCNLTYRFVAPEAQVQALQNGDVNVIEPQATVDTVDQLEGMSDSIAVASGNEMTWEHLDFNFAEGSVFSDEEGGLAAREAFAMCVPRQQIVQNLIQPINPEAEVMNLREKFPFQEDYQEVVDAAYDGRYDEADIEGATAKLEEAGVTTPVEVRIGYSAPNQRRTDEVAAIKASCDEAGFNIVDAGDPKFFEAGGSLETGDWEVALFAWAGSGQIASGQPIYSTNGGQNFGGFSNEEVDAAWNTLASSSDPEVHMEQIKVIEKLLWDNLYGIPIFAHPGIVGYDNTLENVHHNSTQTGVSWNAEQWVRAN